MSLESKIQEAFESLARELSPSPDAWERLATEKLRRNRWRVAAASMVAIVAITATIVLVPRLRSTTPPFNTHPGSVLSTELYRDSILGWSLRYPASWRLQPFYIQSRISVRGLLLTNIDHTFTHPIIRKGLTTTWDFRGLPSDLVAVQFEHSVGGPAVPSSLGPDTQFPLSLGKASVAHDALSDGSPQMLTIPVVTVAGDSGYRVAVWFGPSASEEARAAAYRIVASIAFDGTISGRLLGTAISPGIPLPGSVMFEGPIDYTVDVGDDGRYSIRVPAGTYTIVGQSPKSSGGEGICRAKGSVTVRGGQTVRADVYCLWK